MDHAGEVRRCLEQCDVEGVKRLWHHMAPDLPQPQSDHDILVSIHHARTSANSVHLRLRAYSHAWLRERGYPSALPDDLKPRAERMYPIAVRAVGIAVKSANEGSPVGIAVQRAMEDAVLDIYADPKRWGDDALIKRRMMEARERVHRGA